MKWKIRINRLAHFPYVTSLNQGQSDYAKIEDPIWRLGRTDGRLGQPPKEAEELAKAVCDLYYCNASSFDQDKQTEDGLKFSCVLGLFFLLLFGAFFLAEMELSRNLVELAFNIEEETRGEGIWGYLAIGIAFISVFFKFVWDRLNEHKSNIQTSDKPKTPTSDDKQDAKT